MADQLAESEWIARFVDEALGLFPFAPRDHVTAAAKNGFLAGAEPSPEKAAFAYVDSIVDRILHPPH